MHQTTDQPERRKGPLPSGLHTARYQVLIQPELADWARHQPGGISATVRTALEHYRRIAAAQAS